MYGKCMGKLKNLIFQYVANILCKFDVQQSCRAHGGYLFAKDHY